MEKKWTIHQLERKSDNGFVMNVHWRYAFIENIEDKKYYADVYSVINYTQESDNFIPFEEITEDIVINWVKSSIGENNLLDIEKSLEDQIELQKNPPIIYGLPWESKEDDIDDMQLDNTENIIDEI